MRNRLVQSILRPYRCLHQAARHGHVEHDRQVRDVVPSDLGATLEAHRESNLTAKIRKYDASSEGSERRFPRRRRGSQKEQLPASTQSRLKLAPVNQRNEAGTAVKDHHEQPRPESQEKNAGRKRRTSKINNAKAQASGSYIAPYLRISQDPTLGPQDDAGEDIEEASYVPHLHGIPKTLWSNRPDLLDRVILNLDAWAQSDGEEALTRKLLTSSIMGFLEMRFPELVFELFGSSRTGLMIPSSDIDISFKLRSEDGGPPRKVGSIKAGQTIRRMRKLFYGRNDLSVSHSVLNGRAPLVSLNDQKTGLKIQVVATSNGQRVLPYIQAYLDEFPQLRPLFTLLKLALQSRELHEPGKGGVGAYTLFMMLVAYFKGLAATRNDTLSTTLIRFLTFYEKFDTSKACIAVDPPAIFPKRWPSGKPTLEEARTMRYNDVLRWQSSLGTITDAARPYLLCLQDPTDPSNNLGQASKRIMDVRTTFGVLGRGMRQWLHGVSSKQDTETAEGELVKRAPVIPEDVDLDPLKPLLGDILHTMQMKRRRIRRQRHRLRAGGFNYESRCAD